MPVLFHDAYAPARARFRADAAARGFALSAHDVGQTGPDGGDLTIDVAVKANGPIRRAVVVSSGTHGVEGYFGSAVQLDLLAGPLAAWSPAEGEAVVLIHAVNPYGFAHKRRVNEDNIDLNRNFVPAGQAWEGAHDGYHRLHAIVNPPTPPGRFEPWLLQAAVHIARYGFAALKDAIAQGQYVYPKGLFYGGSGPSRSMQILGEVLPPLFTDAERVLHLDLHTGSGPWGTYVHALDLPSDHPRVARLRDELGADRVQAFEPSGVLYTIRGALGGWLQSIVPHATYDCLLTEFGTYPNLRVLANMRYENRVVQYTTDPARRAKAAALLLETFCPADPTWRTTSVALARDAFERAMRANLG